MIFNKDEYFNSNLEQIKNNYLYINLEELFNLLIQLELLLESSLIPDKAQTTDLDKNSSFNNYIYTGNSRSLDEDIYKPEESDKPNLIHLA